MANSLKTTSTIAAVGMTMYTMHVMIRLYNPLILRETLRMIPNGVDMYLTAWLYLLLAAIILSIYVIIRAKKETEVKLPSKAFVYITYVTAIISALLLFSGLFNPVYISGVAHLYIPSLGRNILLITATIWMWTLTQQTNIGKISKPLRFTGIIGIICLCIPIILQMFSVLSYLSTGYILHLRSWAISSYVKLLVPTILLCWYSIELHKTSKHLQPSNHIIDKS